MQDGDWNQDIRREQSVFGEQVILENSFYEAPFTFLVTRGAGRTTVIASGVYDRLSVSHL